MRDRIETAQRSVIRVLMGGRVTITIRERSIVTITDDPMRTRVDLESGTLAFKVHEGGLRAGEVAELLTPNTITGIRGSLVVAEVSGSDSDVTVLEAHRPITIAPRSNSTQTTQLPVGHTVRVSGPPHAPRFGQIRRALRERLLPTSPECRAGLGTVDRSATSRMTRAPPTSPRSSALTRPRARRCCSGNGARWSNVAATPRPHGAVRTPRTATTRSAARGLTSATTRSGVHGPTSATMPWIVREGRAASAPAADAP